MTAQHVPSDATRELVALHGKAGTPQDTIAALLGISAPTLRKHYSHELETALGEANAVIAGKLYEKALAGNVACMMFWLKTRAGYRETSRTELTGVDGGPIKTEAVTAEDLIERALRLGLDPAALGLASNDS